MIAIDPTPEPAPPVGMETLGKSRIEALSDSVFAFAITLLALDLHVPTGLSHGALEHTLRTFGPRLLTYILSFSIVGVYWVAHHVMIGSLRHVDRTLLWLNILFLLFVVALPTSAAFLGAYPGERSAAIVYGGNLVCASLALNVLWQNACKDRRLILPNVKGEIIQAGFARTAVSVALYMIGMAVSFLNTRISVILYACVPLGYIFVQGFLDRHHQPRQDAPSEPAPPADRTEHPL